MSSPQPSSFSSPTPPSLPTAARAPVYALVGNPNCGKSTLFNALTGLKQKVGNYPGVTVEKKVGTAYSQHGHAMQVIDLPGAYSLAARSPDEAVTRDVLLGRLRPLSRRRTTAAALPHRRRFRPMGAPCRRGLLPHLGPRKAGDRARTLGSRTTVNIYYGGWRIYAFGARHHAGLICIETAEIH